MGTGLGQAQIASVGKETSTSAEGGGEVCTGGERGGAVGLESAHPGDLGRQPGRDKGTGHGSLCSHG